MAYGYILWKIIEKSTILIIWNLNKVVFWKIKPNIWNKQYINNQSKVDVLFELFIRT